MSCVRTTTEFRHYVPLLRRIIILVAVITAVPVVLWTITAFVRTYVGPPKIPTFHQLASTASINAPAGTATPDGTAQLQAAMQANAHRVNQRRQQATRAIRRPHRRDRSSAIVPRKATPARLPKARRGRPRHQRRSRWRSDPRWRRKGPTFSRPPRSPRPTMQHRAASAPLPPHSRRRWIRRPTPYRRQRRCPGRSRCRAIGPARPAWCGPPT